MTFRERLRAFEQELERRMPEFNCSVHLCLGQEGVPEVLHELLRPEDWLFSTHRSHGHYLAKGGSEQKILDEILGLETGVNGGYSGSQSFCDPALRFHSTAIVGGLIGVATGVAYALKLSAARRQPPAKDSPPAVPSCPRRGGAEGDGVVGGEGRLGGVPAGRGGGSTNHQSPITNHSPLVVCCIGDGATEQGVFWESLNFAVLHNLRIVYVCENNGLSVHAPLRARQDRPLQQRVRSFGLHCQEGLDGLRQALNRRMLHWWLPAFVEVQCERECRHVSAMEDLRETSVTGDQ